MRSEPHPRWRISVDRRRGAAEIPRVRQHLKSWLPGVQDLECHWFDADDAERLPDKGAFRDFIPLVDLTHAHLQVLEYIGEEVIDTFGWLIDVHPVAPT
jgi:hypothetical protein